MRLLFSSFRRVLPHPAAHQIGAAHGMDRQALGRDQQLVVRSSGPAREIPGGVEDSRACGAE